MEGFHVQLVPHGHYLGLTRALSGDRTLILFVPRPQGDSLILYDQNGKLCVRLRTTRHGKHPAHGHAYVLGGGAGHCFVALLRR